MTDACVFFTRSLPIEQGRKRKTSCPKPMQSVLGFQSRASNYSKLYIKRKPPQHKLTHSVPGHRRPERLSAAKTWRFLKVKRDRRLLPEYQKKHLTENFSRSNQSSFFFHSFDNTYCIRFIIIISVGVGVNI